MPEIVDWHGADPAEVLPPLVRRLAAGQVVALPTESTYEVTASALQPAAVARVQELGLPALVLTASAEALDWLPFLPSPARRLIRKVNAGPWLLSADGGPAFGLLGRLPEPVQRLLCPEERLTLRWPDQPIWSWALRRLQQPLLSAAFAPAAATAQQAAETLGDRVDVVVNAGPCTLGILPTLIRVTGNQWQLERPGGFSAAEVEELLLCRVLFLCTGNTCRSPMAEALFARLLADRLGCAPTELRQRGFLVQSAGLAAMMGASAASEAVAAVRALGADLSSHRSQPLSLEMLALADHVFAMTDSHLAALENINLPDLPVAQLLSPDGDDVPDPIGAEAEVYRACAQQIMGHLRRRLAQVAC